MPTTFPNSMAYLQARQIGDAQQRGYLSTYLYGADLMGLLPIVTPNDWMQDVQYQIVQPTVRTSSVRLLNEAPDVANANRLTEDTELVAIYTTPAVSVDKRLAEDKPGVFDWNLAQELKNLIKNMNYDIVNSVPDASGRGIIGLKSRCAIGSTYDFNTVANFGTGGAQPISLSTGAGLLKFLQMFRAAHDEMEQSAGTKVVAVTSRFLIQAISAGADSLGAAYTGGIGFTTDIFNRRLTTIDGVPLLPMRGDSVNTPVFPFDEPDPQAGTPNTTSSMLLLAYDGSVAEDSLKIPDGIRLLSTDQSGGGVIRRNYQETLTQHTASEEFDMGMRVPERSIARISGLKR